jgi:hypothetical protein
VSTRTSQDEQNQRSREEGSKQLRERTGVRFHALHRALAAAVRATHLDIAVFVLRNTVSSEIEQASGSESFCIQPSQQKAN